MTVLTSLSSSYKFKRQPIGWLGPSKGSTMSRGKASWRVIDSRGQVIASGFADRAFALRWIDSFNLMQAGYALKRGNPAKGETRLGAMHEPPVCDGLENVTRNDIARCR